MNTSVTKDNIFDQMVVRYFLPKAKAQYYDDTLESASTSSRHENNSLPGLLMFYDGQAVLNRIKQRFTTAPESSLRGEYKINNADELTDIIDSEKDSDHVFTYNSRDGILTKIKTSLDNTAYTSFLGFRRRQDVNKLLEDKLPLDYVSSDYQNQPVINSGSRTRAAVVTVNSNDVNPGNQDRVRAIMVSQTVYNNGVGTGLTGKISEIGKNGLVREAFIYQDENHEGPFLDEKKHLVGVYRTYAREKEGLELSGEYFISVQNGELQLTERAKKHSGISHLENYAAA
jgi:hypothetical protein